MGVVVESGREAIDRYTEVLKRFPKGREKDVLDICKERYRLYWREIHEVLAPKRTTEGEDEIRAHVRTVMAVDLPLCAKKVEFFKKCLPVYERSGSKENLEKCYKYLDEWLRLYEGFYALVAFRSLRHFAEFMEWDKRDKDKVWKYSIDPQGDGGWTGVNFPFFYYFNQMVLKKDVKFISKQQATGTGKSYSNIVAISWVLGLDADNDCLIVLGNPALVLTNTRGIVEMMTSKRFAKVFPEFEQYHDTDDVGVIRNKVFSVCRQKEGELTLSHSGKAMNVKIISKDTPVDGIRVRYLFLDDVCRSKDAGNNKQHEVDVSNYWNSWWKRNYNTEDFYIVVGGTAYSIYDILTTLKIYYSKGKVRRSGVNKYTTLSLDGRCVFVAVPALDFDTDESTYPQKFSTAEKRAMRERNFRDFMAMEQQQPQPPETSPFYWDNLNTYDVIPEEGRSDSCWASIDPVRIGGDNFAMPIFLKVGEWFYLKDCIYMNIEQEKIYQVVVDKIRQHHITQLVIERNTDTSLKKVISDMCSQQGVGFCNIEEVYTYEKKEIRITNQQNNIKTQLRFPAQHLYSQSSEMGRFMYDIVSFTWEMSKNIHDDSIDAVTMFCEKFLGGKFQQYAVVGTFKR